MNDETKPTESTEPKPSIEALFEAFCKQHNVVSVPVAVGPALGTPVPVVEYTPKDWRLELRFVEKK